MEWVWTLALNTPVAVGGWWAAPAFAGKRSPDRLLAAIVLGWVWIVLGMQVLGTIGLLSRGPCLAWAILGMGLGGANRFGRRSKIDVDAPSAPPETIGPSAWIALGLVVWGALWLGGRSYFGPVKVVSDGPIYHLYFAAKWWKAGRIFLVPTPFGESAAPYFPATGDLGFAWLMIGSAGERLAKVGQAPFLVVAGLAAVALARRLGAGLTSAIVGVSLFLGIMPFLMFTFEANVDTIFVAGYLLGVYFLTLASREEFRTRSLILAGLAVGLALGTKPTAVIFVPPLILWGLVVATRSRTWRNPITFLLAAALPSAYWYVSNALRTGNPLYPLHLAPGGIVMLQGWFGRDVMERGKLYSLPVEDWRSFLDIMISVADLRLIPLWIAALAFGVWPVRRDRTNRLTLIWLAGLAVLNVAIYWLLVPYRTQQRFMLQAFGLLVPALALLIDRSRWLRWAVVVLIALHMTTNQLWPFLGLARIPTQERPIPNAIPSIVALPSPADLAREPTAWLALGTFLGLGLGAILSTRGVLRAITSSGWKRRLGGLWPILPTLALVAFLNNNWSGPVAQSFYPGFDFRQGWLAVEGLSGPEGTRIAYAGTNLPFYLMGVGFRNDVRYVNVNDHPGWLLHDYHRQAVAQGRGLAETPRPGWDRESPDFDAWWHNLVRERIALLVVTRANPLEGPHDVSDAERFPIERVWADAHPDRFSLIYSDPVFRIYRIASASL